ncbi:MAG TPA: STT3 domain-containing protein, partial [Candidatus Deferrimicrobium sp.]|nr:STT3 domain-containing protein [Candidatus Deferrimicrobium sp.]
MPSFKDKLIRNFKKIFHRPTVQIGKANIVLYTAIILIFIIALVIRLFPILRYTAELRALDPYVQFKATRYIIENGLPAYFNWHETMSWYPGGVDMGGYLFLGTSLSGAFFYYFFHFLGFNISIYDTCVAVPAIMGALSCIAIYFLGKELAGNKKTGLLAALFLALCVGFQTRTISGFYDNEAVGIFGLIIFFFFFIKSLKSGSIPYAVLGGFGLSILSGTWGGYTYVYDLLPLTVLFLLLLKKYSSRLLLAYSVTFLTAFLTTVLMPAAGWYHITGGEALLNFGMLGLMLLIEFYRRFKVTVAFSYIKTHWKMILRFSLFGILILLIVTSITGVLQQFFSEVVANRILTLLGDRYLTALLPFVSSLTIQSVAEHMPSAWGLFYYNYEFLLFLFPLGLYFLFKRLYEEDLFIIIFGLTTVYFASSMSRLQMVFAPAICLIAAFGVASLIKPFSLVIRKKFLTVRRRKRMTTIVTREISVAIFSLMFFLLLFTSIHGTYNAAYQLAQPGLGYSNDWRETFAWMRANLPHETRVVSWWDYGYQITTIGEVTTVVDNGTWNNTAMGMVGRMFMATDEQESIEILDGEWQADYVLVSWSFFYPNGGGDEGKWQWMIRIAYEKLQGTKWAINVEDRWNETSYKPMCSFFDTTLWKMLVYGEYFVDWDTESGIIRSYLDQNSPYGYFWARLNWADPWYPGNQDEQGQWLDDGGHLWKYHNPPLGQGMIDDGFQDQTQNEVDDTVGQFADLTYFTPAFFSAGRLVKIFKIDYEKAKLRAQVTEDSQLYNNSVADITINNNGQNTFGITGVSINGIAVDFLPISGTTTNIAPGKDCRIKAYGSNVPVGAIVNGSTYSVGVSVQDSSYNTFTATKDLMAEPAPYVNMSINEANIQALSNETLFVPITNTGDDILQIGAVQLNNQSITNFGFQYSSLGENQIDIACNYTATGFTPTNISATEGDLINFHVTNLIPESTIKFGVQEFNKEIQINYGQTKTLTLEADRNGTYPYYCYNILDPPADYVIGNLTILDAPIIENWNYKFVPVGQTRTLHIHPTQNLLPNQLVNLTIATISNENISRKLKNLQVFSSISCLTLLNASAYANETVFLTYKNTGAYDETLDHIWFNGEIFDYYSTPNPHGLTLQRNKSMNFAITFSPTLLNLNITSVYDPLPLRANISLVLGSRTMDPESQHNSQIAIVNDYSLYNISISDEIFSNETVYLNVKNIGSKNVEISDVWINNVGTTIFSLDGSKTIGPNENRNLTITSNLNLNYLDTAQIMVRTYEGPYALINRFVQPSGQINITWSEIYQNNGTIYLNVTNLRAIPVTIKSIFINSIAAQSFNPIDDSFNVLPSSYNTIPGNDYQLLNVTMTFAQFY